MKTTIYSLIGLLLALTACTSEQETKSVELPPAAYANTHVVEIAKVTLTDSMTILDIEATFRPKWWIKISSESALQADGKQYMIRSAEGIDLDSLFWMPESGKASFQLQFEPLPLNTKTFNYNEGGSEGSFKIWGIDLVNKRPRLPKIPRKYTKRQKEETDFQVRWEKGNATVTGKLLGYLPRTIEWTMKYANPITGQEKSVPVEIDKKGSFLVEMPIYSPTNIFLESEVAQIPIKVAPGKESSILVNLPELYRSESHLLKEEKPYGKKYYYSGYLSRLNNDLANEEIMQAVQGEYANIIGDMDANEYKVFLTNIYNESIEHNDALDIIPLAKKIVNATEAFALREKLEFADYNLRDALSKKHMLLRKEAMEAYKPVKKNEDFMDCYQLIPYDDPEIMLIPNIAYQIRNIAYARKQNSDPLDVVRYLSQHEEVSEKDRRIFRSFISAQENSKEFKEAASVESVFNRYRSLSEEYQKNQMGIGFLSQVWNTDKALLFDLINTQKIGSGVENFNPLTDEQKGELSAYSSIIKEALLDENETLLTKIEENKKKTGFTVLDTPSTDNEKLFAEMLKPFKGKVILLDVWATWCGPCRMANKAMEPLKADLADEKELVFLYLAGENSPQNIWENMIPDLKGAHYKVNQAQWDHLGKNLNVRGVPTYIIIDKEGNQSFHSVGFPGEDTIKKELMKVLNS